MFHNCSKEPAIVILNWTIHIILIFKTQHSGKKSFNFRKDQTMVRLFEFISSPRFIILVFTLLGCVFFIHYRGWDGLHTFYISIFKVNQNSIYYKYLVQQLFFITPYYLVNWGVMPYKASWMANAPKIVMETHCWLIIYILRWRCLLAWSQSWRIQMELKLKDRLDKSIQF